MYALRRSSLSAARANKSIVGQSYVGVKLREQGTAVIAICQPVLCVPPTSVIRAGVCCFYHLVNRHVVRAEWVDSWLCFEIPPKSRRQVTRAAA
jgi:hypothetical protein